MAIQFSSSLRFLNVFILAFIATGCDDKVAPVLRKMAGYRSFHDRVGWKPETFFSDPKVIALCNAIKKNDLAAIDRLVAAGADVNAVGKGGMTPLLWSFPDNKFERFEKILSHGANPNVKTTDNLGVRAGFMPGDSVTSLAACTAFPRYFVAVMNHGGDPNQVGRFGKTVLYEIIDAPIPVTEAEERIRVALKKGANVHGVAGQGCTPAMYAATRPRPSIVFLLLENGADPFEYDTFGLRRLVHYVLSGKTYAEKLQQPTAECDRLLQWLESKGEDIEAAKQDVARWKSYSASPHLVGKKFKREIEARKARERNGKAP